MVRRERFVSSFNKELHGSGAGVLFGWYIEGLGLKLRKNAKLSETPSIARRSQFGGVELRARSEVNALSHGY